MKYSVIKRVEGQPDQELCIEASGRKAVENKAKLEIGKTISITKWFEEQPSQAPVVVNKPL